MPGSISAGPSKNAKRACVLALQLAAPGIQENGGSAGKIALEIEALRLLVPGPEIEAGADRHAGAAQRHDEGGEVAVRPV